MTASAKQTLSGWEVRIDLAIDNDPAWLTPEEARALAAELTAAADLADRNEATFAAQHLRVRVLQRLACCSHHVSGGLAELLGEEEPAVLAALTELQRDGKVEPWGGIDGLWCVAGGAT
jgi:hypothetical protein